MYNQQIYTEHLALEIMKKINLFIVIFSLFFSLKVFGQMTWAYGSYTGNGSASGVTGVGFAPDAVMIKSEGASQGVIATTDMTAGETKGMGVQAAHTTGRITSLDSDGFTIGTDAEVNSNTVEYQWIAFQTGGDLSIGTYSGAASGATINSIGFQPEMIWYWGNGNNARDDATMYLSTNSEKCDRFRNGARSVDMIGSLNASGFTTGGHATHGRDRLGAKYFYIAFNAGSDFEVGGWNNGADVDGDSKTLSGSWQSDMVITNAAVDNLRPIFKLESMTGDASLRWSAQSIYANAIQSITSTGFTIGTQDLAQDEWNSMDYAAMKGGTEKTVALPIELIDFDAELIDKTVSLSWSTASEINNDYFNIERSVDGINYKIIDIVQGAGNSMEVLDYQFYDNDPPSGIVYYRIRQIDFDGKNEVFDAKSVYIGTNVKVNWTHTKISNKNKINIYGDLQGTFDVKIININGKVVLDKLFLTSDVINKTSMQIDLPESLNQGVYLVNVTKGNFTKSGKILIQNQR